MIGMKLGEAKVVLLDEKRDIRTLVKSALQGIGFGPVRECKSVDQARQIIKEIIPDLLVVDLDIDGEAVCEMISDVRHERLSSNPFIVIIGLTWRPEGTVIQAALDAGTDDVVKKPVSANLLIERVTNLIENRKDFIATPDYVGPKRGKGVRPESEEVAEVKAPNSLRHKATGDVSAKVDEKAIKRAAQAVALQRLSSLTYDIIKLSQEIEKGLASDDENQAAHHQVHTLTGMMSRVNDLPLPENVPALPHLVASLNSAMEVVRKSAEFKPRHFEILRLNAQAIAAGLRGDVTGGTDVASALGEAVQGVGRPEQRPTGTS